MMDNQRPVRLALQLVILAERHNTQNTGPVQSQQPANGLRRDRGVVINKHAGEPQLNDEDSRRFRQGLAREMCIRDSISAG